MDGLLEASIGAGPGAGATKAADLLGVTFNGGFQWDRRWQGQHMGPPCEEHRAAVREETKQRVLTALGLQHWGQSVEGIVVPPSDLQGGVHLFLDRTPESAVGGASAGGDFLLGRYDVAVVKAHADRDRSWELVQGPQRSFWVAHAAALNVGGATDFQEFSFRSGSLMARRLNETAYLEAMRHIVANIARACTTLAAEHMVFFPFGMGAFLRELGYLDDRFTDSETMQALRRSLTRTFMRALAEGTPDSMSIHLCISFGADEAKCNADAFLRALVEPGTISEGLRQRLTIWPDADALDVARLLAETSPEKVVLVNGANRKIIGNHWFGQGARLAIDENLHRRSWSMSAVAYLLNGWEGRRRARVPEELQRNTEKLGGQVHVIDG